MKTKEELLATVTAVQHLLFAAQQELQDFLKLPENNQFTDLTTALVNIEMVLRDEASNDCEGSNNCGLEYYEQLFMVNGEMYLGKLYCEYNRHDKTYYYLEEARFTYEKQ